MRVLPGVGGARCAGPELPAALSTLKLSHLWLSSPVGQFPNRRHRPALAVCHLLRVRYKAPQSRPRKEPFTKINAQASFVLSSVFKFSVVFFPRGFVVCSTYTLKT